MSPAASPFSGSYHEAREKFLLAATKAFARVTAIEHPLSGPAGETLAIDIGWLGPEDASTVLLCLSGVHGAEGYAGSAAQIAWLNSAAPQNLPQDLAILMVHGVNPWGFAYGLRGTEDNIDINRNWLDHSRPHPANPLYEQIHAVLCPDDLSASSVDAMLDAGGRFVEQHGQWALEDAISRGQYTHADGYHFGGTSLSWSTQQLQHIVATYFGHAKKVAYVDFHSGPVGNGETIFLCFSEPTSAAHKRAGSWWGQDALMPANVEKQWGSRRPTRHGIVFWGLEQLLKDHANVTGAVVEFCSAKSRSDVRYVMRVPMVERWMRFVGGLDGPEAPGYLQEIRENYAPQRGDWERKVAAGAIDVLNKAVAGAGKWSAD